MITYQLQLLQDFQMIVFFLIFTLTFFSGDKALLCELYEKTIIFAY